MKNRRFCIKATCRVFQSNLSGCFPNPHHSDAKNTTAPRQYSKTRNTTSPKEHSPNKKTWGTFWAIKCSYQRRHLWVPMLNSVSLPVASSEEASSFQGKLPSFRRWRRNKKISDLNLRLPPKKKREIKTCVHFFFLFVGFWMRPSGNILEYDSLSLWVLYILKNNFEYVYIYMCVCHILICDCDYICASYKNPHTSQPQRVESGKRSVPSYRVGQVLNAATLEASVGFPAVGLWLLSFFPGFSETDGFLKKKNVQTDGPFGCLFLGFSSGFDFWIFEGLEVVFFVYHAMELLELFTSAPTPSVTKRLLRAPKQGPWTSVF